MNMGERRPNKEKRMDVTRFSKVYTVRHLEKTDVPEALTLCSQNPEYYEHYPPMVTEALVVKDMTALPPGKTAEEKYYLGYYEGNKQVAILDLIDGYPTKEVANIGLFMMAIDRQGEGEGSALIQELCQCLKDLGFEAIELCWVQSNPHAAHFWKKNGFAETGKVVELENATVVAANRVL